ncbi:MAG: amidohydrolase [Pseudomonadota bacterium]
MSRALTAGMLLVLAAGGPGAHASQALEAAVKNDYEQHLGPLFEHFHANPELSFMEFETAARMADEFRELGFTVHEEIGVTGIVALLENGPGPTVMMRADMDGLPVKEMVSLPYRSKVEKENSEGQVFPVMHACGHDVHITSLIGTARQMVANRDQWSGTLMLLGQPAEEWKDSGAKAMKEDGIWDKVAPPDYALAFHVSSEFEAGKIHVDNAAAYSGVDSVDIIVPGVGTHGARPHKGKDPVVIGSQIVLALQTLVARELSPREPGVVTVGVFRAGNKRNVISEQARLEVTVRSDSLETRAKLLGGIKRIAENVGRAAGLPEGNLPRVELMGTLPVTVNDGELASRLRGAWGRELGETIFADYQRDGMGGEDFPYLTNDPYIPSVYFKVGGTLAEDFAREAAGETSVAAHHSPWFKIAPEPAVRTGVVATVTALLELMPVE